MNRFTGSGITLTRLQMECLMAAAVDRQIYGERPSFSGAQTPNGTRPFDQRTIDSLVRRGLLASDGKSGFVPTAEGSALQRKALW